MEINPDYAAPCGLYCGVCAIQLAHRENNQKFKEVLVLSTILALMSYLAFVLVLKLQFPVWPAFITG